MGVMIVVPTLATGDKGHEPVVVTLFLCPVITVAPQVRHGIDAPGDVPHQHRSQDNSPQKYATAELQACQPTAGEHSPHDPRHAKIERGMAQINAQQVLAALEPQAYRLAKNVPSIARAAGALSGPRRAITSQI